MSDPVLNEVILLRYGELFLKGANRGTFERALVDNLKRAVKGQGRVERTHGRMLVWPGEGGARKLVKALERVFGLASLSVARIVAKEPAAIYAAAVEEARAEVSRRGGKPSFKVAARRADKRFQPASPEIARVAGGHIVEALALPVDVHNPDFTVGVEVGFEHAFVFAESVAGPGGLPGGVSGRIELLLSGGIDSPVAAWLMLKRGCSISATYFHSPPYVGEKSRDKVVALARKLAAWQLTDVRLSVVNFTTAQKALRDADPEGRLAVVLYRRMMLRVAERIAKKNGAQALCTGEALAQVASQTLTNLSTIGQAASLEILRPCLGHDKLETIALARKIGTYETSIEPYDDCCSLFVPEHPETRASLEAVQSIEARLDLAALAEACTVEVVACAP
jgi:thiamine biosynthesis protein ThiI